MALINSSPFGNGTAIFTRDGGAARRFQLEVEAGMVGVNVPIPVPVGYHSFGGWKDWLFGDHHIYGNDGIALLHPRQGRHHPLARPRRRPLRRRPGLPAQPLRQPATEAVRCPASGEIGRRGTAMPGLSTLDGSGSRTSLRFFVAPPAIPVRLNGTEEPDQNAVFKRPAVFDLRIS